MTRRRHRRFAPSLAGAASRLEDRVVLSTVGLVANPAPLQDPSGPGNPGNGAVGPEYPTSPTPTPRPIA